MNVVGYISREGELGRTFLSQGEDDLKSAVLELTTDCNEPELFMEVLGDLLNGTSSYTENGTYFHGELERNEKNI